MELGLILLLAILVCPYIIFNVAQVRQDGDTFRSSVSMLVLFALVVIAIGLFS